MSEILIQLQGQMGNTGFLVLMGLVGVILCFIAIPWSTDMMVNASAGLTEKYLGPKWRTTVINGSTNNPELITMVAALVAGRVGGIGNPLGSNFANIYLMYLVAPLWVMLSWKMRGKQDELQAFKRLLGEEKRLVAWHIIAATMLFVCSVGVFYLLTGQLPFGSGTGHDPVAPAAESAAPAAMFATSDLILAIVCSVIVIAGFIVAMNKQNRKRPELVEEIDTEGQVASWAQFFLGTGVLVACCWTMNAMFAASTVLYQTSLQSVLGTAIFAALHYFIGALVTSLPEMKVALDNYRHLKAPDLNTALASASVSNMTNMAIATIGSIFALIALALGFELIV